jgi:hypothetical protein
MGFIKQNKVSGVAAAAKRAHEEGRRFFVAQLHPGAWSTGLQSGPAGDLALSFHLGLGPVQRA